MQGTKFRTIWSRILSYCPWYDKKLTWKVLSFELFHQFQFRLLDTWHKCSLGALDVQDANIRRFQSKIMSYCPWYDFNFTWKVLFFELLLCFLSYSSDTWHKCQLGALNVQDTNSRRFCWRILELLPLFDLKSLVL